MTETDPQTGHITSNSKLGKDCPIKLMSTVIHDTNLPGGDGGDAVAEVSFILTASKHNLQLFANHLVLCQTFATEWDGKTGLLMSQRRGLVPTSAEITENPGPLENRRF